MEETKPKRKYIKIEANKIYHFTILFDRPIAVEKEHPTIKGFVMKGYKYALKNRDTEEEISTIIGQGSKINEKLMSLPRGTDFDLRKRTFEKNGQRRQVFEVAEPDGFADWSGLGAKGNVPMVNTTPIKPKVEAISDVDLTSLF